MRCIARSLGHHSALSLKIGEAFEVCRLDQAFTPSSGCLWSILVLNQDQPMAMTCWRRPRSRKTGSVCENSIGKSYESAIAVVVQHARALDVTLELVVVVVSRCLSCGEIDRRAFFFFFFSASTRLSWCPIVDDGVGVRRRASVWPGKRPRVGGTI